MLSSARSSIAHAYAEMTKNNMNMKLNVLKLKNHFEQYIIIIIGSQVVVQHDCVLHIIKSGEHTC